jgi:hypothetical protein
VAAGLYYNLGISQTLIEAWDGSLWTIIPSPDTSSSQNNQLNAVSCTSSSFCVAVGFYQSGTMDKTLIEIWDGTSWTIAPSPSPSPTENNQLNGVSCTSATFCEATGAIEQSDTSQDQTLVETWDGTSWTITPSPTTSQGTVLVGVSCTSASFCESVGLYYNPEQTLVETWDGTSWTITPSPNVPGAQANDLLGVSCSSSSFCAAVGNSNYETATLAEDWDGTSWTITPSSNPASSVYNELLGTSCTSSSFCDAVGDSYNGTVYQTLVETQKVQTATAISSSLNPASYGAPVTFTATVSPTDGGGTVSFTTDGNPIPGCSGDPLSLVSGSTYQATCTTSALAAGNHVVEASYSGDTQYSDSSATITQTVNQQTTATTLSPKPNPSVYGQKITFTATVSPADGQGTVSFSRGTGTNKTALCPNQSLTLVASSYQASCSISSLPAGTYTITAAYSGDTDYGGSAATVQQTVNKIPTTTSVSSSKNPSRYRQSVTFTATITSADGGGTVTFWYAGNTIAGCTSKPLQPSGSSYTANCTTSSLPVGTDKVKAVYNGDKNSFSSTGTVSQVVNRIPTATKIKSSPDPSTFGQTVKLTATVSPNDGGGTVAFSANGHAIAGCAAKTLTWTGSSYQAACKTSALPRGTDTVKAAYSGDTDYKASSGTVTQHVN